mgnify:CR=1 FL=1
MSVYAGPEIVNSGLILHLDAGSLKSYPGTGNTWYDLSGSGLSATLVNGPTFQTDGGGCINLTTVNTYISCPTTGMAGPSMTAETWVKPKSINNAHWFVIDNYDQPELRLSFTVTGLLVQYYDNSNYFLNTPIGGNWSSSSWYHVVSTFTNGSQKVYVNGVLRSSATGVYDGNATNNAYEHTLGTYNRPSAGYNGYADVKYGMHKIYNRVLTASEVLQNFNAMRSRFGT